VLVGEDGPTASRGGHKPSHAHLSLCNKCQWQSRKTSPLITNVSHAQPGDWDVTITSATMPGDLEVFCTPLSTKLSHITRRPLCTHTQQIYTMPRQQAHVRDSRSPGRRQDVVWLTKFTENPRATVFTAAELASTRGWCSNDNTATDPATTKARATPENYHSPCSTHRWTTRTTSHAPDNKIHAALSRP
jgi:hypothetical protein